MAKRQTFQITYNGETYKRSSDSRTYTHAVVHTRDDGSFGEVTWHMSAQGAANARPNYMRHRNGPKHVITI
jgi:hypothetical protein